MTRDELMTMLSALCRRGLLDWRIYDLFIDASHPTTPQPFEPAFCMLDSGGSTTYQKILIACMKEIADAA